MAKLADSMDSEKARQKQLLADRIAERKKQKESSLKQKHGVEMEQELVKQRKQRDELSEKQVRVWEKLVRDRLYPGKTCRD